MNGITLRSGGLAMAAAGIGCALAGGLAGWLWTSRGASLHGADKVAVEITVRDYILNHPEILPQAMGNLRKREDARQLANVADDVETPFPGAILGNPDGKVTLVEFMDFACGYCRQSVAAVEALIAANPDLRVVVRQLPILSPASAVAARMGLAAAEQGKYAAFHRAMYLAGHLDPQSIQAAAQVAGLDMDQANKAIAQPQIASEIDRNADIARKLGFEGTPSWVIGDEIHSGAIGQQRLAEAIAKARG